MTDPHRVSPVWVAAAPREAAAAAAADLEPSTAAPYAPSYEMEGYGFSEPPVPERGVAKPIPRYNAAVAAAAATAAATPPDTPAAAAVPPMGPPMPVAPPLRLICPAPAQQPLYPSALPPTAVRAMSRPPPKVIPTHNVRAPTGSSQIRGLSKSRSPHRPPVPHNLDSSNAPRSDWAAEAEAEAIQREHAAAASTAAAAAPYGFYKDAELLGDEEEYHGEVVDESVLDEEDATHEPPPPGTR